MSRTGWICPKCGVAVSPDEKTCPTCSEAKTIFNHGVIVHIPDPNTPTVFDPTPTFAKRGVKLEGVRGYVCGQPGCPTGLGSPSCSVTNFRFEGHA